MLVAEVYVYGGVDHGFNNPARGAFNRLASSLAHSRPLGFLHAAIGPRYDLEALWQKHVQYEFVTRNVDDTMVAELYVNHVPNMTAGYGYRGLYRFRENHFIPKVPKSTKIILIAFDRPQYACGRVYLLLYPRPRNRFHTARNSSHR